MLMLMQSIHLLSFSPQILPNRVSRIPYTRKVFKLLQKSDQVSALPHQSSLERSSRLGSAPSQYEGFKPKSWALCVQPPVLDVVNHHMAGHSRLRHYSWKTTATTENKDAAGQVFALAAMWKPFPDLFTAFASESAPPPHCNYSCEASVFVLN